MKSLVTRRHALRASTAAGIVLAAPGIARAQDTVDNLKILVGFPAGGTADVVARWLSDKLVPSFAS